MSNNILFCNDAAASHKQLQTTKIQIPGEDRIVKTTLFDEQTGDRKISENHRNTKAL